MRQFDAVVIGSGAFGSSTAFHLAAMHGLRVALLDRYEIASQTSPRAAGLTRQVGKHLDLMRQTSLSIEKLTCFAEETGEPLAYFQTGSVTIARTPEHADALRQQIAQGREAGLDVHEIAAADLATMAPYTRPDGILAMGYTSADLYLEPSQVPRGYARAAERAGAVVLPNTPVESVQIEHGTVVGVTTDTERISAPIVVEASGAWSQRIAAEQGIRVPTVPVRHQLLVTEPITGIEPHHAICRVMDARVYVRPDRGGLMLGGYESVPQPVDMHCTPEGFQISDLALDRRVLDHLADCVGTIFPLFATASIREIRGGLPTMTPDNLPLIGPVPGISGFFVATGCCVGGLSISPGVGQTLAEFIAVGKSSVPLDAFSLARFAGRFQTEEELRAACIAAYGSGYSSSDA